MTRKWRARVAAHVETWRPYTSGYVGLVGLAGAGLAAAHPGGWRLAAAWAIPTMGWLAGLYGGDYFDRELDAVSKPQRPIPSGRLPAGTALACMIGLIAVAGAWAAVLNWRALVLVAIATGTGLSYNGFFKAKGLAGNLVRGSLTSFACLFGALMTGHGIGLPVVAAALAFALQDSASNLVGTLRDIDGDRAGGYLTYPVRHGVPAAVRVIAALFAAVPVPVLTAAALGARGWTPASGVLLLAALAVAGSVVVRLYRARGALSRPFALGLHETLCLERIVLAAALAAWGAGAPLAIGVGVPALAVTWVSQRRLRARHEFAPESPRQYAAGPAPLRHRARGPDESTRAAGAVLLTAADARDPAAGGDAGQ